jgi:hypothetical protein
MDYGEWTPNSRGGYNRWDAVSCSTTQVTPVKDHLIMYQSHKLMNTHAFMVILNKGYTTLMYSFSNVNNRSSLEGGQRFWSHLTT